MSPPKYKDGLCIKCVEEDEKRSKELKEKMEELQKLLDSTSKKIKVLCIDDLPTILETYKMILKIKDIEVVTALDGESGLPLLTPEYDMVFTGHNLGRDKMNGIEVLRRIKDKYNYMPVAIITAYSTESSRSNAIKLGAFEYLRKPFLMEELYELVLRGIKLRGRI